MASKSLSVEADKKEADGESSYRRSELCAGVQLNKSESRLLREQADREELNSTRALVAAYNYAKTEDESKALHQWLQRYSPYLEASFAESADDGVYEEMSCLAEIKPRCEEDKVVIRKTVFFLGQQVTDIRTDQQKAVTALATALQAVDESVFDGDAAALLKLSDALLSNLDPTQTVFVDATCDTHSMTLFALHQALLIVQRITSPVADTSQKPQWFQTFKQKLNRIAYCQSHFPFFFRVKLVEQCLERLVYDCPTSLRVLSRRMISILSGCCYLYSGVRKSLTADVDLDTLIKGFEALKEAIACQEHRQEWYDAFLKLNGATLVSSKSMVFGNDFLTCFQDVMTVEKSLSRGEDEDLLRFGIITQLSYSILHGKSPVFSEDAIIELLYLAGRHLICEGWGRQPAIIGAIMPSLSDAYSKPLFKEMVNGIVCCMKPFNTQAIRDGIELWLERKAVQDKLREHPVPEESPMKRHYLFRIVQSTMGSSCNQEKVGMVEKLRSLYQSPKFAKVPGLLEEHVEKDIASLQFHILCDSNSADEDEKESSNPSLKENQLLEFFERTRTSRRSIALEDLFSNRCIVSTRERHRVRKVVLVGNPGTGKTAIGKRLANGWAKGSLEKEFRILYFFSVAEFNKQRHKKGTNVREQQILECAITDLLFSTIVEKTDLDTYVMQVYNDLASEATLLVFDGLEETGDIRYRMLCQALQKSCSLLLLTRPHNLDKIRKHVHVEMECVGLTDEQLKDFFKSEIPKPHIMRLMKYLQQNPHVLRLARTPIMTSMLCSFWKGTETPINAKQSSDIAIFQFYALLINFLLGKFRESNPHARFFAEKNLYLFLQETSLDLFLKGGIEISQGLIKRSSSKCALHDFLEHCGYFLLNKRKKYLQFIHPTFQEFFSGLALAKMLFHSNEIKKNRAVKCLSSSRFGDHFALTLTFVTQSVCEEHGYDGFNLLIDVATRGQGTHVTPRLISHKLIV